MFVSCIIYTTKFQHSFALLILEKKLYIIKYILLPLIIYL